MASFNWLAGIIVLFSICVQVHGQSRVLDIFFAEVDFREIEGEGAIKATIIKEGPLMSDLCLNIIPLTYEEFDARGFELAPERRLTRPDAAELELNGRRDFDDTVQELVLRAGLTSDDYDIFIPITRDTFNEASEGFMIVMRPNEVKSNPQDVENIMFQDNGVSLGVIDDDDPVVLGFERSVYSVQEGSRTLNSLVSVIKREGQITEQVLRLIVDSFDITAEAGRDYNEVNELSLVFQPEERRKTIPITLLDNNVPEPTEEFRLVISRDLDNPNLLLDREDTIIRIEDSDDVEIGFSQAMYIVNEGETVEVCVQLSGPDEIDDDLFALLSVSTILRTASADDFIIPNNFVALNNEMRQACFNVQAFADGVPENTEDVTIVIDTNRDLTPGNIIIRQPNVTLLINSNECEENNDDCSDDAQCVDTVQGFECICPNGLSGTGGTCSDINECIENLDDCGDNALCVNNIGSFECQCQNGFRGDGQTCLDINECAENLDDCNANEVCINTIGSYECRPCQAGFQREGQLCIDLNECAEDLDDCDENADCSNMQGSFDCTCQQGFTGDGRVCVAVVSRPELVDECSTQQDDCSPIADCIDLENGFECRCPAGFSGNGRICTADVNECSGRCYTHSRCVNQEGSYKCVCDSGYIPWGRMCMDRNECRDGSHECDENARCTNTAGSYTCTCNSGFTGDGLRCRKQQRLSCRSGYKPWGRRCMDINECRDGSNDCDEDAYCTNTPGSYRCTCARGFTGDGFTCRQLQSIDPCDDSDDEDIVRTPGTHSTRTGTHSTHTDTETDSTHTDTETDSTHTDTETDSTHTDTETDSTHTDTDTDSTHTDTETDSTHTDTETDSTHATHTGTRSHRGRRSTDRDERWATSAMCAPQQNAGSDSSESTSHHSTTTAGTTHSTTRGTRRGSRRRSHSGRSNK